MSHLHHFARCFGWNLVRPGAMLAACVLLAMGVGGCRHRTTVPLSQLVVLRPVDLEEVSSDADSLPMVAALPPPELGPLENEPIAPPVPRRRPAAPKDDTSVQPPIQVASAAEPATLAIGALSTGGDVGAQTQQATRDLIASILKRIAALPAKTAQEQKREVRQVRNFLDQAQKALNSGDAEGSNNLANKARLLMDDLEKK